MLNLRGFDGRSWAEHFALQECKNAIFLWPDRRCLPDLRAELSLCDEPFKLARYCAFLKGAYESSYLNSGLDVVPLDYDRLVEDPTTVDEVAKFFGCSPRSTDSIGKPSGMLIGQTDPGRSIDSASRSRYKTILSEDQMAGIHLLEERWGRLIEDHRMSLV